MTETIKEKMSDILQLCKDMQLDSLYLFGSGARGKDFHKNSDIDFLFQFKKDMDGLPLSSYDYFDLLFRLEDILGKKVDLVAEERIRNKYFREKVDKEKIKIYEA